MKSFYLLILALIPAFLQAQNVGIGVDTPFMRLHVAKSDSELVLIENTTPLIANIANDLYFKTGARFTGAIKTVGESNLDAKLSFYTRATANRNGLRERLTILDIGNVGIGNPSPQMKLSVVEANSRVLELENSMALTNNVETDLHFKIGGKFAASVRAIAVGTTQARVGIFAGTGDDFVGQSEIMSVTDFGKVGIGIKDPFGALHIKSAPYLGSFPHLIVEHDGAEAARIQLKNNVANAAWEMVGISGVSTAASYLSIDNIFNSVRTNVMRILGNGNVGIGTTTPTGSLHIKTNSSISKPHLRLEESETEFARIKLANGTAGFWDIAGMGSTTASSAFFNLYFNNGTTGSDRFSLAGTGNLTIAGTLTENSDARLKTDITQLDNSMDKLLSLHGYHYHWKEADRDPNLQTGLLAQEVEKVMPELVVTNDAGIKSLNYNGLVPYLLEAIKELKAEVEQLKAAK